MAATELKTDQLFQIGMGYLPFPRETLDRERMAVSAACLDRYLKESNDGLLYGVDTCFGPHAFGFTPDRERLQENLVWHLSVTRPHRGEYLNLEESRTILAARIRVLGLGYSGIQIDTLEALLEFLEKDRIPLIPTRGSLGASGDLIPLSALALALKGEGEFSGKGSSDSLRMTPKRFSPKEAIAITNGTSFMAGLLTHQWGIGKRFGELILDTLSHLFSILPIYSDAFHSDLTKLSGLPEMVYVSDFLYPKIKNRRKIPGQRVQDSYVIRCIPEILGSFFHSMGSLESELKNEINSVSDNPVYSESEDRFLEGGLFYGGRISQLIEVWNLAVVSLCVWLERMIQFLLDPSENESRLPLMLSSSPGVDAGFSGYGLLATHIVAELRRDANPGSIQSIPTNAGNQNIVPMGGVGVIRNRRSLDQFRRVLEIYLIVWGQATHLLDPLQGGKFSKNSRFSPVYESIFSLIPVQPEQNLGKNLESIGKALENFLFCPKTDK